MAPLRKNLLEAFQKSGRAPEEESVGPAPQPSDATLRARPIGATPGLPVLPGWLPWTVLVGLAFVAGLLIGGRGERGVAAGASAETASAPESDADGASAARGRSLPLEPAPATASGEQRIEDSALFDRANLYTIVVAAYDRGNADYAWATFEHLKAAKLDPFPPVAHKDKVLILVGAAPTRAELAESEARVEAVVRDGGRPYESAYRESIDKLIER